MVMHLSWTVNPYLIVHHHLHTTYCFLFVCIDIHCWMPRCEAYISHAGTCVHNLPHTQHVKTAQLVFCKQHVIVGKWWSSMEMNLRSKLAHSPQIIEEFSYNYAWLACPLSLLLMDMVTNEKCITLLLAWNTPFVVSLLFSKLTVFYTALACHHLCHKEHSWQ